ncbi:MAG: diaminopimelate epimerase [Thermoleophilaceae bacterium]
MSAARATTYADGPRRANGTVPSAGASVPFWKCYVEGNSYVVIEALPGASALNRWAADATRGLGGDGLIVIEDSPHAPLHHMRVFNADGTEAAWCGNGARAAAALICDRDGLGEGDTVTIESAGGLAEHELLDRDDWRFRARMPVQADPIVEVSDDKRLVQTLIGAPHLIVFGPRPSDDEIAAAGSALCAARPGGTNVMFATHDADGSLTVTPWERGVGPVLGCATGGAAAAIAAERVLGRPFDGGYVRQPGGAIEVEWDGVSGVLAMTGTVRVIATGAVALERAQSPAEGVPVAG